MTSTPLADLATDIAADVRTSLNILRAFRADLRTPARHLPALDTAIAANERALARWEAAMPGDLTAPTG
jgi:hypothetical protein